MQEDGMKPKTIVLLLIILLVANCFVSFNYIEKCKASVLPRFYVDNDYNILTPGWHVDHFDKIQDAIDNATSGDRIVVYEGTYYEHLTISIKLDVFGEERNITTIDGGGSGTVITISNQSVNISHFTITNSGSSEGNAVIRINNSGNSIITDNVISYGGQGILLSNSSNNLIYNNIIKYNDGDGIRLNKSDSNDITYNNVRNNNNGMFLYNSSDNTIENNVVRSNDENGAFLNETSNNNDLISNNFSSNTKNGIYLNDHCNYNTLSTNQIHSNTDSGIRLENSSINVLNSNVVYSNTNYGIMIVGSSNMIQSNEVSFNKQHGMFLFADDHNVISDNNISRSTHDGIRLYNSTNDSIYRNKIYNNSGYGAYLDFFTIANLVCNNYFCGNGHNAYDGSINRGNAWNISKTLGTNKIGGPYLGGNYWGDYTGSDSNGDGLGDIQYTIFGNNKDKLPLIDVVSPAIISVAVSPASQTVGSYTYISATVTDNIAVSNVYLVVTYPSSQIVNFSIVQNKTGNVYYSNKIYTSAGTYSFYVTATDARHNWNSTYLSPRSFEIHEGLPPTVTDNSATTGSPGSIFKFNATVTDDEDSSLELTVKVIWSHGKFGETDYLVNTYGNYFEWEVKLYNSTDSLKYYFYASDVWGNSVTTTEKTVSIVDTEPPKIKISKYGPSFDALPNSFTFDAAITDDHRVSDVTIEYWYGDSSHITTDMDYKGNYIYEKIILPEGSPERVYCIIYAIDPSGNQNDSRNPFAKINGPYLGFVTRELTFNAIGSFDLDGNITEYSWDFGDGTTGTGISPTHAYSTNGNYTIKLTAKDNDARTDINTTYAVIYPFIQLKTSYARLSELNARYNINLSELFYGYDSDGDTFVDKFVDPNDVLKAVHTGYINISANTVFLISIDDTSIPEFMWNATTNRIISLSHILGTINTTVEDEEENTAIVSVSLNKTKGWIYLEITDKYPDSDDLTVKANNTIIPSDRIWRKGGNVYVLDDPWIEYQLTYQNIYQPPSLELLSISPVNGGIIDENNPSVRLEYSVPVTILDATFGDIMITLEDIVTTDDKTFTYTPPASLEDSTYNFYIIVKDKETGEELETSVVYFYFSYVVAQEETGPSWTSMMILFGGIAAVGIALLLIMRYKHITLDSFIYIKNKKIAPFFRPVIIGPLTIDVNDDRVNKAEFYVDGKLKNTITEAPYIWEWNESAFMKHTIETKIYDQDGNSISSGEMTFFVFNSSKLFK